MQYGDRPVMKLSAGKATAPGEKQVFRSDAGDAIGLRDETAPDGAEPILVQVMAGGRRTHADRISEARARFQGDLARLPEAARRISDPQQPTPSFTDGLLRLADVARASLTHRS